MVNKARFPSDPVEMYNRDGFAVLKAFNESQVRILERFAKDWIYRLLAEWTSGKEESFPLETYHIWSKSLMIDHGNVFRARNRYLYPDKSVEKALLNDEFKSFLDRIGLKQHEIWDDGWGWLGFRFIRPGAEDGYPLSRKAWGIARNVVSCWVPIIGYSPSETLTLVPGSHLKEYEKYLPTDDKFTKNEYRLANIPPDLERHNPNLERGEVIIYHPKTLHSENVVGSSVTRLNLEFRFKPLNTEDQKRVNLQAECK